MSAQADTNCHDIFNVVLATRTHLAKIGATCHVMPTCCDMSATFPAKAYTAREHTRWRYLVASHEATNTLHWSMCLASYLPGGMVVAIAVESATLYYIVD